MKRKYRVVLIFAGILLLVLLSILFVRYIFPASLDQEDIKTARIERGDVIQTIPAEGIVEPENEVLLRSPANSVIKNIIKGPGSYVTPGEVIMVIDPQPIISDITKLEDQIEVKKNNLRRNRLNARSIKIDLDYNVEMKKLKIASIKSELADQEQLLAVGGISPAKYDQTKQELVIAEKDLEMILEKNSIRLKQLEAEEEGLQLQIEIQEKELEEKRKILEQMSIKANTAGIILNTYGKEGEKVSSGELLVSKSDLSSYKISGSIDEKFAESIKTGREVFIEVDSEIIKGKIGNIKPIIENNKVLFDVFLQNSSNSKLIPNMKVGLQIVRARRDSVLRVPAGEAFDNGGDQMVFVIKDEKAIRTDVKTGIKGNNYIEILSGLKEGDDIIISDISSFRHNKEIEISD